MKTFILILLLVQGSISHASTFVGNGGNTGDVELQVTINQIKKSLSNIKKGNYAPGDLCSCSEHLQSHKVCETLKSLSELQLQYCEKNIQSKAQEMLDLLMGTSSVQVQWTSEPMQVLEKTSLRDAEGVTQPLEKVIYLNKSQFIALKDYERIFLLTHELGHLVQFENLPNKYLRDDEIIGPFTQADGGRQFLNSLGAAVTMETLYNGGISEYKDALQRPKSYNQHWIDVQFSSESNHKDESTFNIQKYSGSQIGYRYQFNQQWGLGLQTGVTEGVEKFMTTVDATNTLQFTSLSAYYRFFPNDNPLSYWGQSHLLLGLGFGVGNGKMALVEGTLTSVDDDVAFSSPVVSANYYFPAMQNFWITLGTQATFYKYEYATIGFKSEPIQLKTNLGVSYAF